MSNPYHVANQPLIYRKLLKDAPQIEADFKEFKQEYQSLLEKEHGSRSVILQSHLVMEYYLTRYLESANPASPKIGTAKLSVSQKLDLADHDRANFHFLMTGMRALNSIRNKITHRLDHIPTERDLTPIRECIRIWNSALGKPMPNEADLLTAFTEIVCGFLHADTQAINRHGKGAGFIGLLNWWNDS